MTASPPPPASPAPAKRGFFTTPSWTRSAVAMSLLIGAVGCLLGSALIAQAIGGGKAQGVPIGTLIMGGVAVVTGIAALATGLRGVRAWKLDHPIPVAWYWPGIAGGVMQGVLCSGGLALDYFLGGGSMGTAPAWLVGLTMFTVGGIPFLAALCCAGAWWTERYAKDGEPTPELQ